MFSLLAVLVAGTYTKQSALLLKTLIYEVTLHNEPSLLLNPSEYLPDGGRGGSERVFCAGLKNSFRVFFKGSMADYAVLGAFCDQSI